jgi:hypothetical protein
MDELIERQVARLASLLEGHTIVGEKEGSPLVEQPEGRLACLQPNGRPTATTLVARVQSHLHVERC